MLRPMGRFGMTVWRRGTSSLGRLSCAKCWMELSNLERGLAFMPSLVFLFHLVTFVTLLFLLMRALTLELGCGPAVGAMTRRGATATGRRGAC